MARLLFVSLLLFVTLSSPAHCRVLPAVRSVENTWGAVAASAADIHGNDDVLDHLDDVSDDNGYDEDLFDLEDLDIGDLDISDLDEDGLDDLFDEEPIGQYKTRKQVIDMYNRNQYLPIDFYNTF